MMKFTPGDVGSHLGDWPGIGRRKRFGAGISPPLLFRRLAVGNATVRQTMSTNNMTD
jgi:hypothetical protein